MDYIALEYPERLHQILDESWRIYKAQFINGRHQINREAPFQHHFAQILKSVGDLYSIGKHDLFKVNLEHKFEKVRNKTKYIDITCEYVNHITCAIELKFKTDVQGAQDHGRIDAYLDIEALEEIVSKGYGFGKFYMITDSKSYIKESKKGVGTIFKTFDGALIPLKSNFISDSKGRENVIVSLNNSYTFQWENIGKWYFLEISIHPKYNENTLENRRINYKRAYEKWSLEEDEKLKTLIKIKTVKELSLFFERNEGAIKSRIKKLNN